MRAARLILLLSGIILIYAGCAKDTSISAPEKWDFGMQKIWEIQKAGDDTLLRPAEPRIADDGTVYFHDFERHLSYIIDSNGKLVGTFANRGTGEGEVQIYINCFTAGDKVAICSMDKILFFTNKGQFVKEIPNNLFFRFPLAFKNDNEFWVAPGALGDSPTDSAEVIFINLTSNEESIVHKFSRSASEEKTTGGAVVIGLTPQIKMGYDKNIDRVYFGKNSDTVIYCLNNNDDQLKTFSFTGVTKPVTEQEKRNHFSGHDIPEEYLSGIISAIPDQTTYYNRIQVFNGLVYLFRSESFGSPITGQIVDIYSPDGHRVYYGEVLIEDGWHISGSPDNFQMANGIVYTIEENDAGEKRIVKYKISLPKS